MRALTRLAAALGVAAALATTACGKDSTTAPKNEPAGEYTLRTVNGQTLPVAVIDIPDAQLEITAGHLTLSSEGLFVQSTTITRSGGPLPSTSVSLVCSGSWARRGSAAITLTFDANQPCAQAGAVEAAYEGDTITLTDVQGTLVYHR